MLDQHDLMVLFCRRILIFHFDHFTTNYLSQGKVTIMYNFLSPRKKKDTSLDKGRKDESLIQKNRNYDITEILAYAFIAMAQKDEHQVTIL